MLIVYMVLLVFPNVYSMMSQFQNTPNSTNFFKVKHVLETINNILKFDVLKLNTTLKNHKLSLDSVNSTVDCVKAFIKLNSSEIFSFIDAAGKPLPGLAFGGLNWMGSSSECLSQKNTAFCTMNNIFVNGLSSPIAPAINLGLCVPDKCSAEDVTNLLKVISQLTSLFTIRENDQSVKTFGGDAFCSKPKTEYSNGTIVMIFITSALLFLSVFGTLAEIIKDFKNKHTSVYIFHIDEDDDDAKDYIKKNDTEIQNDGTFLKLLICFSLIKNSKAVFNTDSPDGAIGSINGIRVLSIMWVILGHVLVFDNNTFDDMLLVVSWGKRFTMQAVLNATLSVDTFFLLSGLLVAYLSLKRFNKTGSLPLLRYYVHRYVRLTPSYAYMIFFMAYIFPVLSSGPFWYTMTSQTSQIKSCVSYWWTNLLYINNLYPDQTQMCAGHSWYLANDMQFYVLSPIVLWLMYRFKLTGTLVVNVSLIVICFIINGVLMWNFDASPLVLQGVNDIGNIKVLNYMKYIYMKPYVRYSPYLVGLVLGYLLTYKFTLSGRYKYLINVIGWFSAIVTGMAVIYGPFTVTDHKWSPAEVYTYGIVFRFVWAVAVSWVIFACHTGYGGLINDILSWRAFIPLGRLSYGAYLFHPMVMNLYFASLQVAYDMTVLNYAYIFVSISALSFGCAYVISVCIEYPVYNLELLFF